MKIEKSKGFTQGEQGVAEICEKSFLSLWSYPNLFYEKNKELCDVLIVFGNTVFIISEKTSTFDPERRGIKVEWNRFKNNIIDKSYRQLNGAEKRLKQFPDKIFMDPACTKPFPIPINKNARFIKISVINGLDKINKIRDRVKEGDIDVPIDMQIFEMRSDNYIHLLDDYTFPTLFRELDTAADLISYFTKKEDLIVSGKLVFVPPESDFLVMFLSNFDENFGEHCFFKDGDKFDRIFIDNPEDPYPVFINRPDVIMKKEANKISYLWDAIIERYNKTLLDDRITGELGFYERLKISELMSQENRYFRRMLSEKLNVAYNTFNDEINRRVICMQSPTNKELVYACLILRRPFYESNKDYEQHVNLLMEIYSKSLKMRFPQYKQVLCFTRAFPDEYRSSMYFSLFDKELSSMDREYVERCSEHYKIATNFAPIMFRHTPEYPKNSDELRVVYSKKIPVNAKCPCGSGKKYKKCCGKLY